MDEPDHGDAMVTIAIVVSRVETLVLAVWLALYGSLTAIGVFAGVFSAWWLVGSPLSALSVPVNPQGRGDFFLAPATA